MALLKSWLRHPPAARSIEILLKCYTTWEPVTDGKVAKLDRKTVAEFSKYLGSATEGFDSLPAWVQDELMKAKHAE